MTPLSHTRWLALGALALAACNDPPTAPPPDQLVVTRPSALVGAPGFPLMDTIFVRVLDAAGKPRVGVEVSWVVRDGGGSVLPLWPTSGTDGTAAAIWTLGPRPGYNELRVSISEELSHTFTATGEVFRATEVVGDFFRGCGLVDGAIWCWGRGAPVQGAPASSYEPASATPRPYGTRYTDRGPGLYDDAREYSDLALAGWGGQVCALDVLGAVWCTPANSNLPPAEVVGFPPIAGGTLIGYPGTGNLGVAACGLAAADGRAWCLKDGSVAMVPGSPAFTVLRTDDSGTLFCGLQGDSTAACWGDRPPGDGSSTPSPVPVPVEGGHRFVDLVVGEYFGCGRTTTWELWCWGNNYTRQPVWLEPMLSATGVTLVGATWYTMLVGKQGGVLLRRMGPDLRPEDWNPPLTGLEHVAVAGVAEGGMGCVLGAGDEVYCVREQWSYGSGTDYYGYFPVMPIRQAPPTPAMLR